MEVSDADIELSSPNEHGEDICHQCPLCNARCPATRTSKFCEQCGNRLRVKRKSKRTKPSYPDTCTGKSDPSTISVIAPQENGWFCGHQNVAGLVVSEKSCPSGSKPLSLKPITDIKIDSKPDSVVEKAKTASPLPDKLDRLKHRSLHRSLSIGDRDLPPLSAVTLESKETLATVKSSQTDSSLTGPTPPCVLWGLCLDNAIAEFEAKEIILHAEIDSDERCMSVLVQRLKIEDAARSKYTVNNASSQLRIKYTDLEKKVRINREKLTDVRTRLKALRAQQDGDPSTSDPLLSNQTIVLDNNPDPDPSYSTARKKKKKKQIKKKIDVAAGNKTRDDAAIKIQRRYRVLRARRMFGEMVKRAYQRVYDPDTKQYFYYNTHTRQSQWESPPMLDKVKSEQKKLHKRRKQVRQPSEPSLHAAASRIQSLFRRRAARIAMRKMLAQVYEKIYDADTNSYYYYCKNTKTSTWEKPKLLKNGDDLETMAVPFATKTSVIVSGVAATSEHHTAACKIQSIYRNRAVRLFILDLAMGKIEKHFDANSQAWYYYNHRTQQTFWENAMQAQLSAASTAAKEAKTNGSKG